MSTSRASRCFQALYRSAQPSSKAFCGTPAWSPNQAAARHVPQLPLWRPLHVQPSATRALTAQRSLLHTAATCCATEQPADASSVVKPWRKKKWTGRKRVRFTELTLNELLAEVTALSHTPEEAVQKLRELEYIPQQAMDGQMAQEAAECIHALLKQASADAAPEGASINELPYYLFRGSRAASQHPHVVQILQTDPYRELIVSMIGTSVADADGEVFNDSLPVSQLCSTQYNLGIYCEQFWQKLPEESIPTWDAQATSDILRTYGRLHELGAAPDASDKLKALQRAAVVYHAADFHPQGVSRVTQSFAKQGLPFGDALLSLQQAAARTAPEMRGPSTTNCLSAFAAVGEELGCARDPLMNNVERLAKGLTAPQVAGCLWACVSLKLEPGEWSTRLIQQVEKVAEDLDATELQQVRDSLQWLQEQGCAGDDMQGALLSVGAGSERMHA